MARNTFGEKYGPWAVVAGASEGLGEAFARELARRGLHLVLLARRRDRLEALAEQLRASDGVQVRVVVSDLTEPATPRHIAAETAGLDVRLFIYNAAASVIGPFLETAPDLHANILRVNAESPTLLIHAFGRRMVEKGSGGIVLMTSLSAFQGSALISTYAATKAYLLSLGEALSHELRGSGVDILACAAGATRTPNYVASRPAAGGLFRPPEMEPADVAREALSTLGRKPVLIAGRRNRLSHVVLHRLLPRRVAVRVMGRAMDRLYGRGR